MIGNIRIRRDGIRELERDSSVAEALRPHAESVLGKARRRAPSWVEAVWFVRHGVSDVGAFAQAIGRGSGVVAAEYGGRTSPPHGFFRSAVR